MKVLTYTNIWSAERKIYALGDLSLPTPVSFKQIGLFMLTGIPWFALLALIHFPLNNGVTAIVWFGVPIGLAILGNRKLLEEKSIFEYLGSQIQYVFEPKNIYDGKADNTMGKTYRIESKVWKKNNKETE